MSELGLLVREFLRGYISLHLRDPRRLQGNPGQTFNPGVWNVSDEWTRPLTVQAKTVIN
ncbi:MAG: hypothetical protein ABIN54_04020 [candidate division WOR-3 bacterium]